MVQKLQHAGCDLAYSLAGSGPPVLMIQGVGVAGSGWRPQVQELSERYTCLTYDNRGLGASQPAAAQLSVEMLADDAAALLALCGTPAHVVGHSLGGLIALGLALKAPEKVRSLSLLCTFADGREATRLTPWMLWVGLRTRIGSRRSRRRAFLQLVLPPAELVNIDQDAVAVELAELFGHDLADSAPVTLSQMAAMRACNLTARLPALGAIPTLVLSARHDQIARPELGRALAQGIPGARFVEFEDASHGAPISCAARVNSLLAEHFRAADTGLAAARV